MFLWNFAGCGLFSLVHPVNGDDCGLGDVDEGYVVHGVRCSHCYEGTSDEELEGQAITMHLSTVYQMIALTVCGIDGPGIISIMSLTRTFCTWHS
jgi:hypothetical protein